jgi:hypothetical protein
MMGYQHRPLNTNTTAEFGTKQIRLFRLTSPSQILLGELQIFDLDHAPPYMALSYMWGDAANDNTIWIDDQPFMIRQNLFDFLHSFATMRTKEFDTIFANKGDRCTSPFDAYIWIDQLCIDQKCVRERNHQVQLMERIYKRAWQVVVWLGKDADTMDGFAKLKEISHVDFTEYEDMHIKKVGRNAYWSRLWIVQEFILAKELTLMCGNEWLGNDQLGLLSSFDTSILYELLRFRNIYRDRNHPFDSSAMLAAFCRNACMDPRDKVYGLLGLFNNSSFPIQPDYTKTVDAVFVETVLRVVENVVEQMDLWKLLRMVYIPSDISLFAYALRHEMGLEDSSLISAEWHRSNALDLPGNVPGWKWLLDLDTYLTALWLKARDQRLQRTRNREWKPYWPSTLGTVSQGSSRSNAWLVN